jgi:hypothetical protein
MLYALKKNDMLNTIKLRLPVLLPLILMVVLAAGIGFFMSAVNYDWQGLVLVTAIVGIVAFFLIPRLARQENDGGFLLKVMGVSLLLKIAFALMRNWLSFSIYGGLFDAGGYHHYGTLISQYLWDLDFGKIAHFMQWGTKFVDLFTGFVYSIIGPSIYGGYLVYAFLAFLGSYFFYRAFLITFTEGNKKLFAVLVFFFPTILWWANGIGKDALVFLGIGLFAYGAAQIIRNQWQGLLPLTLGLLGTLFIRPHITVILVLAFVLAFFLPVAGKRQVRTATSIIVILAIVVISWFLLPRVMSYINLNEISPQGVMDLLQQQQGHSSVGGAAFQAVDFANPLTYPIAVVNILFRPFPWEAHSLQALIQSLEGVLVIGLVLWRIKSLGKAIASLMSNTYSRFVLIYAIVFIIVFTGVANFGILARERTMFFPFFFMLIAYTPFQTIHDDKVLKVVVK